MSQGDVMYQQQERYNSAVDGHLNFKLGGIYRRGSGVDACSILSRSVGLTNRR